MSISLYTVGKALTAKTSCSLFVSCYIIRNLKVSTEAILHVWSNDLYGAISQIQVQVNMYFFIIIDM